MLFPTWARVRRRARPCPQRRDPGMRYAEHRSLKIRSGYASDGAHVRRSRVTRLHGVARSSVGHRRPRSEAGSRRTELGGVRGTAPVLRWSDGGCLPEPDHRLLESTRRVRGFWCCRRRRSRGGRCRRRLSGERTLHADHGATAEKRVRAATRLGGGGRRRRRRFDEWRRDGRCRSGRRRRRHTEHGLLQSRACRRGRRLERSATRRANLRAVGVRLSASGANQHFYAL